MKDKRNSSLDLLRVLSMWMVVMLHVFGNGQVLGNTTTGSANWLLGNILNSFCIDQRILPLHFKI